MRTASNTQKLCHKNAQRLKIMERKGSKSVVTEKHTPQRGVNTANAARKGRCAGKKEAKSDQMPHHKNAFLEWVS